MAFMTKALFNQFLRFSAVGLSGTAVQYACVALAIAVSGKTASVFGSAIGYLLGSVVNYILNYFLTFDSDKSHTEAASKYFTVLGVGWCLSLGLMSLFVLHLNWNPWTSQLITTGIGLCWNFAGSKFWVFKDVPIKRTK